MAASTASGTPAKPKGGNGKRPAAARRKPGQRAGIPAGLDDSQVAEWQAAAENAAPPRPTITFKGKEFRLSGGIPEMALMKFAVIAESGADSASMRGRTAMHALLRFAVYQGEPCTCAFRDGEGADLEAGLVWHTADCGWTLGDWAEFEQHAMDSYATHADFLNLVVEIIEARTGRPTSPPSGSSATDGGTSPNSKAPSSSAAAAPPARPELDGLTAVDDLLS